ncbi:MAG: oxaloacetate decarboxylase subunit alpha [Lachnospiraceae bacterium]|nr:oxaloacetate decarboxylase subunit alpha [Lachnospiraceae bacterium]
MTDKAKKPNNQNTAAKPAAKPIKITETILRDAHQSLIATRMSTEQMLPIVEKLDKVGYHSVECWGGATFDASLRFLKEDPWDRLRKLRDGFKNTKLQMLFRGQNILGYRPYADDVVEYFVQKSAANGIDIIRIFDCLNDLRNLQTAVTAANKEKVHAQVAMSYTLGSAYTLEYWVDLAKRIEEMGADSICIKDMAGLLLPYQATELVTALKGAVKIPIQLHTHYTSGVASMTYLKAVEAGVDVIDTAMSPFALGTSQPATEVMVETFKGTPYDTGFDSQLLDEIADYFRPMRDQALESGLLNPKNMGVNIKTLLYQVPGGMLSNLTSQLKDMHAEDKYYEVLEEVPKVRKDLGEPPLVTPSSQIVGTQAVMNIVGGERYKMVTKETKDILSGKYGATVKPFNEEVKKKCIGDAETITCRPADLIPDELDTLRSEMAQWSEQDEDVLSYALFPQVAVDFFKYRQAQEQKVDPTLADEKNKAYPA